LSSGSVADAEERERGVWFARRRPSGVIALSPPDFSGTAAAWGHVYDAGVNAQLGGP